MVQAMSEDEKADFDQFFDNMRKSSEWSMPNYRPKLTGYPGLGELRWESCKK